MDYIKFSLLFILIHGVSYMVAGVLALKISKDIYESKNRHCDFLRDVSDPKENKHIQMMFLPAQILRGLLMSIVLFPVLNTIREFPFALKFIFFGSLMFIYTHIAAVSPFIDNIEGLVYFKKNYVIKKYLLKFQMEMVIYSVLFGLLMSIFT
jgi:hypothetical protein